MTRSAANPAAGEEEETLYSGEPVIEHVIVDEQQHHQQQPQQQQQMDSKFILARVEEFLLPVVTSSSFSTKAASTARAFDVHGLSPHARLQDVLYQVALADHIRTMQTMYRDSHDEHRLVSELRTEHAGVALPTKKLMTKITEGRVRAMALCRLCFGNDSVEMLRATIDLASSYALQGMWQQVSEHMAMASQKLVAIANPHVKMQQLRRTVAARHAAAKVECTYRVLRAHAMSHYGQVTRDVLQELIIELAKLPPNTTTSSSSSSSSSSPGRGDEDGEYYNGEEEPEEDGELRVEEALSHPMQLAALLHGFISRYGSSSTARANSSSSMSSAQRGGNNGANKGGNSSAPSWGEVVDYLRNDCLLMQNWVRDMDGGLLPQNKASLRIPFRQADAQKRFATHPAQLSHFMTRVPAAARVLAGGGLAKKLSTLKVETPLVINPMTGQVKDVALCQAAIARGAMVVGPGELNVLYELPVLWEECLALHVLELEGDPVDVLKAQVLTLLGVCHIFSNKLSAAEDNMREALRQLEAFGLEMEITSCELYNAIAQMMIMRHRQWQVQRKSKSKRDALLYLQTEEGANELKNQIEDIHKQVKENGLERVTASYAEAKARSILLRIHVKRLLAQEEDPTAKSVEAAFRYLVRSHEILAQVHGPIHPSVGTACLAAASVQNIVGNWESAREWLVRGLRSLERLDPVPHRALAFVQIQLSQVLSKQGHEDEALRVLDKAAAFHMAKAKAGLAAISQASSSGAAAAQATSAVSGAPPATPPVVLPLTKGSLVYDDVRQAIDLTTKIVKMSAQRGGKWPAADQAEVVAELAENAFGWDSIECAETRREVGDRCVAISDYRRAVASYKKSLEAYEALFGRADKRTVACARLLALAHEKKDSQFGGGEPNKGTAILEDDDDNAGSDNEDGALSPSSPSSPPNPKAAAVPAQARKKTLARAMSAPGKRRSGGGGGGSGGTKSSNNIMPPPASPSSPLTLSPDVKERRSLR